MQVGMIVHLTGIERVLERISSELSQGSRPGSTTRVVGVDPGAKGGEGPEKAEARPRAFLWLWQSIPELLNTGFMSGRR